MCLLYSAEMPIYFAQDCNQPSSPFCMIFTTQKPYWHTECTCTKQAFRDFRHGIQIVLGRKWDFLCSQLILGLGPLVDAVSALPLALGSYLNMPKAAYCKHLLVSLEALCFGATSVSAVGRPNCPGELVHQEAALNQRWAGQGSLVGLNSNFSKQFLPY